MLEINGSYHHSLPPRKVRIERKKGTKIRLLVENEEKALVDEDSIPTRRQEGKNRRTHSLILSCYPLVFFFIVGVWFIYVKIAL
ncbi:hypothetical protein MZM54_04045 [[Brevibacterium] frigoritolerans]|nr:hypothetical protein [Peribacillus frigoritolerans]